jgi:hypothetical protein
MFLALECCLVRVRTTTEWNMTFTANLLAVLGLSLVLTVPVRAENDVPFSASIVTAPHPLDLGVCPDGSFPCLFLDIQGTGRASHMGWITGAGPSTVNFSTGTQTGSFLFTAANGDTFSLVFSGTVVGTGNVGDPASFEGNWEAVQGSGRFAGVTGGGTYEGTAEGGVGILFLDGRISRVGSK